MKNIFIIAKKEFRNYFNSPTAYVVLVAFLLLWQFLFFRNVFLIGKANLSPMFDILPWIFLLFIPALTMGIIAQEKSQGTIEFLLTRPVKEIELLAGKFLGSLVFVAIALLFMFPIAWSLDKFGNLDWGVAFSQYLASLGMAMVFVSLGIFISGIFKSLVSSLLTTALASFFLVVMGLEFATARLPLALIPYFEYASVLSHFQSMARGVIDIRDVWYFISASAIFLCLAYIILLRNKFGSWKLMDKNIQTGIVLVIGIAIVSNVAISRVPLRADLTQEKIFVLSQPTKQILAGLDDLVEISFYRSEKLPPQFQPVLRQVKDTLKDYQTFSNGNIVVKEKNPSSSEEVAEEALSLGIQEMRFNVVSQEEFQIKTGFMGIAVSYGGEHESIPFVQNTNDLEYQLTSFIRKLTLEEKPKVAFVQGHGEKTLMGELSLLKRELSNEYEVVEISSSSTQAADEEGENIQTAKDLEIPQDAAVLVVAGPNQEISSQNRQKIKDFANEGGSVLYLIDNIEISPQTFSASKNQHGFADFLEEEYGISINEDLVYDLRSNEIVSFNNGSGMVFNLSYPFWIKSVAPEQATITSKVQSVLLPWASSISIDEGKVAEKDFEITRLLSTTETGSSQSGQFNISPEQKFASKGLTQKLVALAAKSSENAQTQKRFVVVGDSDFLTDQYVQNNPQNLGFGIESIAWLAQEQSLASIRLKNIADRSLAFDDPSQPNTVKYGNMAVALFLPAGYGAIRLARRKKRKMLSYEQS